MVATATAPCARPESHHLKRAVGHSSVALRSGWVHGSRLAFPCVAVWVCPPAGLFLQAPVKAQGAPAALLDSAQVTPEPPTGTLVAEASSACVASSCPGRTQACAQCCVQSVWCHAPHVLKDPKSSS